MYISEKDSKKSVLLEKLKVKPEGDSMDEIFSDREDEPEPLPNLKKIKSQYDGFNMKNNFEEIEENFRGLVDGNILRMVEIDIADKSYESFSKQNIDELGFFHSLNISLQNINEVEFKLKKYGKVFNSFVLQPNVLNYGMEALKKFYDYNNFCQISKEHDQTLSNDFFLMNAFLGVNSVLIDYSSSSQEKELIDYTETFFKYLQNNENREGIVNTEKIKSKLSIKKNSGLFSFRTRNLVIKLNIGSIGLLSHLLSNSQLYNKLGAKNFVCELRFSFLSNLKAVTKIIKIEEEFINYKEFNLKNDSESMLIAKLVSPKELAFLKFEIFIIQNGFSLEKEEELLAAQIFLVDEIRSGLRTIYFGAWATFLLVQIKKQDLS